jgi:signal peptidase I
MAEESIPSQPADHPATTEVQPGSPVPPTSSTPTRNGYAPSGERQGEKRHLSASELRRFVGWLFGLVIVLGCGWGALGLAFHFTRSNTHHPDLAFALAVVLDLALFVFLEQNFWLSRLMGLRITPRSRAWQSAVLLWAFGVVGLLFRSTETAGPSTHTEAQPRSTPQQGEGHADSIREIIETVVFVVVLVLMLRSFVAEAFVIPTGSMAETLYGYQKTVRCPDCGNTFEVNRSNQVDPSDGIRAEVTGCTCPYCRLPIDFVSYELTDASFAALRAAKVPQNILAKLENLKDTPASLDTFEKELAVHLREQDLLEFRDVVKKNARFTTPRFIKDPPKGLVPDLVWDWSPFVWDWVPDWNSGDRVLVAKPFYDLAPREPDRHDIVVFRFPGDDSFPMSGPYRKDTQMNYIKRFIGKPGETIAVHRGKLYFLPPQQSPQYDDIAAAKGDPNKLALLWQKEHMHINSEKSLEKWRHGDFGMVRKDPDVVLSMMRPVYDHDHPSQVMPERWTATPGWVADGRSFRSEPSTKGGAGAGKEDDFQMLHYRHLCNRSRPDQPELISDYMGYNTYVPHRNTPPGQNWVSDLILECEVVVPNNPSGTFVLELSKGHDRFQARWDLASPEGQCRLYRLNPQLTEKLKGEIKPLSGGETALRGAGTYRLRFANVDDRLLVWVNGQLAFDPAPYTPDKREEPWEENDLRRPAGIGVDGASVTVRHIKLFRDTYYTTGRDHSPNNPDAGPNVDLGKPDTWRPLSELPVLTMYVQPGHYLCLGDNSPESSDGRSWGTVPQRLLLGRAVLVYYPFARGGRIR